MINVTKTYMPSKEKYLKYIDKIYSSGWITNNGPLVQELEKKLAMHLNVKNIILVANGTIALDIAHKALGIKDEVITTPFSFVATTSSLVASGIKPIYADIDPTTYNLDADNIISKITSKTSAIVPVHVFGNACDVEKIDKIAKEHKLKVIYDAAHAFDVRYKDRSVLEYGDISTLSFHATKLFHTIEGGALIVNDDSIVEKIRYLINFGIESEDNIPELGINGKMNEFEAAMGLCILDDMDDILMKRKAIVQRYKDGLKGIVDFQKQNTDSTPNYSYFSILFENETTLAKIQEKLNKEEIYPRRYFYPSLDTLSYVDSPKPMLISQSISKKILCLPVYTSLEESVIDKIINIIRKDA